jgi:hypothetical protein
VSALQDLVAFARVEVESHDLEPWAEVLAELRIRGVVDDEGAYWLVKLYNAYDDLGSAWCAYRRWPSPRAWARAADAEDAADFPCTQERRGLRGGRVLIHLGSYVAHLADTDQALWIDAGRAGGYRAFLRHLRQVWGVGRQTAYEWAEFLLKVCGVPVVATDAQLWESEGPRRALQRLYNNPDPSPAWLDERGAEARETLAEAGVPLSWEDFETVICDFNVMRDGRYYPGRHLAALREEINGVLEPGDRALLLDAFRAVVPDPWNEMPPGIDARLMPVYRDTGRIVTPTEALR